MESLADALTDDQSMLDEAAWKVVWDHPGYRYSYELVPGDPNTYTSLRRQIRSLKREYAAWYQHWVMRCALVDKVSYNMKAVSRKAKEAGAAEKSPPLEQDRSEALGRTASTSTRNSARAPASTPMRSDISDDADAEPL